MNVGSKDYIQSAYIIEYLLSSCKGFPYPYCQANIWVKVLCKNYWQPTLGKCTDSRVLALKYKEGWQREFALERGVDPSLMLRLDSCDSTYIIESG